MTIGSAMLRPMSMSRALIVTIAACTPYAPDLGSEPFQCGTEDPVCPDGYACVGTVCTNMSGSGSGMCAMTFSGVLATWTLTGQPGSQASSPSTSSAAGITAGSLSRAPALMAASGANSINSSNWSTAQLDMTKFYTMTITPHAGCSISASSIAIDVTASATGPSAASVATSADAFATTTPISTRAPSTPAITSTASGMIELRVYGFSASGTTGTMRIQNQLTISGALQ